MEIQNINDKYIVSKYFTLRNGKYMVSSAASKKISLPENQKDKEYILNKYYDSDSLHESLQRIFYKIDHKPLCPICGKPVKWIGKEKKLMTKTCGMVECFGKYRYNESKKTNLKKYGVENCYQSNDKKQKIKNTWMLKYGVDNPLKNDKVKDKLKHTCMLKYGVPNGGGSIDALQKIKQTNLNKRGVTCPFKDEKIKEKIKQTCIDKYGVDNPASSEYVKKKMKETCLERYGAEFYFQSNTYRKDLNVYLEKQRITKKRNHTYTSSKSEAFIYAKLVHYFDKIICQYYDAERYPYSCDFYIPEIDTFIEYQGYVSHQDHPFDKNNKNDIELKNKFIDKINSGKTYYKCIIETWVNKDVEKRNKAKENNLNYIEFWNIEEVDKWLLNYDKKY